MWAAGGYTSDKAFKNVIGDCTEGWSKLKDVQPKSYRYKRISNVEQEVVQLKKCLVMTTWIVIFIMVLLPKN